MFLTTCIIIPARSYFVNVFFEFFQNYLYKFPAGSCIRILGHRAVRLELPSHLFRRVSGAGRPACQSLAEFANATGGRVDSARTSVPKFGRSEGSRASAKSQAHHTDWLKSINAQSTSLNTVAKYYDARYNNTEEYRLLMQYANSVKSGWLSPLAGFDLYKSTHERIQTELVGKTTADGTVITGHTAHFMERMFGTLVDPDKLKYDLKIIRRSGVGYEAMRDTVLNPERINPVKTDSRGKRSVRLIGKAIVMINPDTGQLIQLNPRSEQK